MEPKSWSEQLDAKILDWMKRVPPPPLWLLLAMHGVSLVVVIALLIWSFLK